MNYIVHSNKLSGLASIAYVMIATNVFIGMLEKSQRTFEVGQVENFMGLLVLCVSKSFKCLVEMIFNLLRGWKYDAFHEALRDWCRVISYADRLNSDSIAAFWTFRGGDNRAYWFLIIKLKVGWFTLKFLDFFNFVKDIDLLFWSKRKLIFIQW